MFILLKHLKSKECKHSVITRDTPPKLVAVNQKILKNRPEGKIPELVEN